MSLFDQKPLQQKKKRKAPEPRRQASFPKSAPRKENLRKENPRRAFQPAPIKKRTNTGNKTSFPVSALTTIAAAALTVVVSFVALNWKELNINTTEMLAFPLSENSNAGEHTIRYASTGVPGIHRLTAVQERADDTALTEAEMASGLPGEAAASDNHHGMLVSFEWQQYRVKKNDTVSGIAQKFDISVGSIIASNDIRNARRLQEGTVLRIPNVDGIPYQVKRGDSLLKISAAHNVPLEVILDVNDIKSDNIKLGETIFIPGARMNDVDLRLSLGDLFMYPLQSRYITSGYGMRKDPKTGVLQFHAGIDFRGKTGTTIMASLDGVVSIVGENWLYGKYIIISHSNGYKTLYGHMNSYSVKQGDRVARGRKIGEVGNTGYSTGPHLHFGIYDKNNKLVNPLELLN